MNDVDVSSKMTREIFEQKSQSILERVKLPLEQVRAQPVFVNLSIFKQLELVVKQDKLS